jgi:hypothetical protein
MVDRFSTTYLPPFSKGGGVFFEGHNILLFLVLDRNVWVKSISIDQMSSNLGSKEW